MTVHAVFPLCLNSQRCFIFPILKLTQICVFNISILLSVGSQKWSLLSYSLKHAVAHNPVWRYGQLNFVPVSLFMAEHIWHLMLTLNKPASVVNLVECFWVLMHGACLPCIAVCGQGTLPASYINSLTNISLIVSVMILSHKSWDW